ncbi:MAG: lamin tail domain-containing protein [Bacteroidota bacterium]
MKKSLTILLLVLVFTSIRVCAQDIVITEIMYNDPSAGATGDSLEFVEIYNNSADPIDMTAYQMSGAVSFTFPSFTLQPYVYQVIAKSSIKAETYFGIAGTYQWTTGQTLANNGGDVIIKSNTGLTMDSVRYSPNAPWPGSAAGNGSSVMLCDPSLNNTIGSNWIASGLLNANAYGMVNGTPCYATPGAGCNTVNPYLPVFASIPYFQGFDANWINGDGLRNVPDYSWNSQPAMGNNSFRRSDDGHTAAGWNTTTGGYTPIAANGSANSARFHSSGSALSGIMDLFLDFSTNGIKKLKFWYINTSGTDSLSLYLSQDNGASFTFLTKYTTATAWQLKSQDLGNITSSTVILRFKATGTAAAGGTDIGLDEVEVFLAPVNDAGISAITQPTSAMASATNDVKVTLSNFGSGDLTYADINWEVNGVSQGVYNWSGYIPSASSQSDIVLGSFSFPTSGSSVITAWTSNPNSQPDGNTANDSAFKSVYFQPYASIPYDEGFDSAWVNKMDSLDVPSNYWNNQPGTGNASWRRDDQGGAANWTNIATGIYNPTAANGTLYSARFHTATAAVGATGTLLCFVDFTNPGYKELRFNYMNTSGTDSLAVWKSEDGGSTFSFLQKFTTATNWAQEVIQLGNSASPNVVIRFRATRNAGGGAQTDIGLDQVHIGFTPPDAGILSVVSPTSGCSLSSNETVTVKVKNFGFVPISNVPVFFKHNSTVIQETLPGTLVAGDTLTYTFNTTVDLSAPGSGSMSFYVAVAGDINAANDTLLKSISNIFAINAFPFLEDFNAGNTNYLILQSATNAAVMVDTAIGVNNTQGLKMTGGAVAGTWPNGSGNTTTPAQAWSYTDHQGSAASCFVDASSLSNPELKLSLRQINITNGGPRYSYFRVLINDTIQLANSAGITNFNPLTPVNDLYTNEVFDLSAFGNTQFKITLESACKYAPGGAYALGDNVFIDDFIIDEKPSQEVGMIALTSPASGCDLTFAEHISVTVKNNGVFPAINFPIRLKVDNGSWATENFSLLIMPDSTVSYTFMMASNLNAVGPHAITVVVNLNGDPNASNDTLKASLSKVPYITTYPYFQDFEAAYTGWTSGSITGPDDWVVGTPAKATLNNAFSGVNCWVSGITANYQSNSNTYVVSPCYNFSSLTHPYLSVYLNFLTQNNFDAMILEASVNDSAWYKVPVDTLFYNNYGLQLPVAPPKWSGTSNGFTKYGTTIQSLAGKAKVRFRFRFETNANTVNEGFCIDDFEIKEATADVQCLSWISPTPACSFGIAEQIGISLMNVGEMPLTNLPVSYSTNNGATFVTDTVYGTLMPSQTINHYFLQTTNLSAGAPFSCIAKAILPADPSPANNIVHYTLNLLPHINTVPFYDGFEGAINYFQMTGGANASAAITSGIGLVASTGIQFTGLLAGSWPGGTSNSTTAAQAYSYADHMSSASTCSITVSGVNSLWLKLALRQTHSTGPLYSWFRVMLNGTQQLSDTSGVSDYNPATATADVFSWKVFDITPYISSPFTTTLEASCKYDDMNATGGNGDKAQVDSVILMKPVLIGINEIANEPYLITYPNPVSSTLRVEFGKTIPSGELSLVDELGRTVFLRSLENSQGLMIDMADFSSGVYSLKLKTDHSMLIQKVIKK